MQVGAAGINMIKEFEGYETKLPNGNCQAYLDTLVSPSLRSPGYKGLWTIGYGCTVGVTQGMVWTEYQATQRLMAEVSKHVRALNIKLAARKQTLDQNSFDALISASYNLGSASSLIDGVLNKLQAGDEEGAADVFLQYNHAGGRVVSGLTRRRQAERTLFLTHTQDTLARAAPSLGILKKARAFLASLGIGTYFTWDTFTEVHTYVQDHAGAILLASGVTMFISWKAIEYFVFKDQQSGVLNNEDND